MRLQNKITKEELFFILKVVIFVGFLNLLWLFVNIKVEKEIEWVSVTYGDKIEKTNGIISEKEWYKRGRYSKGYNYTVDLEDKSILFSVDFEFYSKYDENDIIPIYKYKDYYELTRYNLAEKIVKKEIKYPLIYVDNLLFSVIILVDFVFIFFVITLVYYYFYNDNKGESE